MHVDHAAPATAQIAQIDSVTVYPPGEEPIRYDSKHVAQAGISNGQLLVVALPDESGQQVVYCGVPFKMVMQPPSGIVMPGRPRVA